MPEPSHSIHPFRFWSTASGILSLLCVAPSLWAQVTTQTTIADSFVRGGSFSTTNFGTETVLEIKERSVEEFTRRAYCSFDLTGITNVQSAQLNVYGRGNEAGATLQVHAVSADWYETNLVWTNQPPWLQLLDERPVQTADAWHALDVTSAVTSGMTNVAFALVDEDATDNDLIRIHSRENPSGNAPCLHIIQFLSTNGLSVSAGPKPIFDLPGTGTVYGSVIVSGGTDPTSVTTTWSLVNGPGTVVFGDASAPTTTVSVSTGGVYVLRLVAQSPTATAEDNVTLHAFSPSWGGPSPQPCPSGIWISPSRIRQLPMSGAAWANMKTIADEPAGVPNLADQDEETNVRTLAKALVYVRTEETSYRNEVMDALQVVTTNELDRDTTRSLAVGRKLAAYVIAADLIDLADADPVLEAAFRVKLADLLTADLDGWTLQTAQDLRPNNWGTMAGASRAAIAVYLGDTQELARCAEVFEGYLGNRDRYAGFIFDADLSWHSQPLAPVGLNPVGGTIEGHDVDGALTEEMRRGAPFQWPPVFTTYPWEALQGALVLAEILYRAGYDAWRWEHGALRRAVLFLESIGWPAAGDDVWQPWLLNHVYDMNLTVDTNGVRMGKIIGWTDWTHPAPRTDEPDPCTYQLDLDVQGGDASLSHTSGAYPAGATLMLHVTPDDYFGWTGWSGEVTETNNPLSFVLQRDSQLTANLEPLLVTNGIPQWWLASFDLPPTDEAALQDSDGDHLAAWEEYYAGTIPTNAQSALRLHLHLDNNYNLYASWPSATNAVYHLQMSTNLQVGFQQSLPPTPATPPTNTLLIGTNWAELGAFRVSLTVD